jgi:hypothetical protein
MAFNLLINLFFIHDVGAINRVILKKMIFNYLTVGDRDDWI